MTGDAKLPDHYRRLRERHPDLADAFEALGKAAYAAGPLDGETARLVKLGLAVGAGHEGAVHSHVRRAVEAGIDPAKIRHAVLLAVTTLGFPAAMRALTWAEDVLDARG